MFIASAYKKDSGAPDERNMLLLVRRESNEHFAPLELELIVAVLTVYKHCVPTGLPCNALVLLPTKESAYSFD